MWIYKVSFNQSRYLNGEFAETENDVLNVKAENADQAIEKARKHVNELVIEVPDEDLPENQDDKYSYAYNCTNEVSEICDIDVE